MASWWQAARFFGKRPFYHSWGGKNVRVFDVSGFGNPAQVPFVSYKKRNVGSNHVCVSAWIALAAERHDSRILPGPWSSTLEFYPQAAPVISQAGSWSLTLEFYPQVAQVISHASALPGKPYNACGAV